jgi:hypothetical protein
LQLLSQLLSFLISTTGHNNVCSVSRKSDCGSATDALSMSLGSKQLAYSSKIGLKVRRPESDSLYEFISPATASDTSLSCSRAIELVPFMAPLPDHPDNF